jgi:hypothetical protein
MRMEKELETMSARALVEAKASIRRAAVRNRFITHLEA